LNTESGLLPNKNTTISTQKKPAGNRYNLPKSQRRYREDECRWFCLGLERMNSAPAKVRSAKANDRDFVLVAICFGLIVAIWQALSMVENYILFTL
jgi:hypothetical protein